ncbi:hypothetical protein BHM03_00024973 [Ensete ventricosum]|nr:hypothetical protein BHM03_00024973 [Ensete ventricosum]
MQTASRLIRRLPATERHCGFSPVPFDIGMYRAVTVNFNHRHPLLGGFSLATTREEVGERGRTSDGAAL